MGNQSKKKKRTEDIRSTVTEIKRTIDFDANRLALQPAFEGVGYMPLGWNITDFINVSTSIVTGTQTGT